MEKIILNIRVQVSEDIQSDFSDRIIPAGTMGTVIEYYKNPEGYAIDLAIPDENMTGGFAYENVILTAEQFIVTGNILNIKQHSDISVYFKSEKV